MRKALAGIFLGIFFASSVAHAEDAAPAKGVTGGVTAGAPAFTIAKAPDFVPFVIDRVQYEAVMEHLNGLPFKTALPLVKWLGELEERAKKQWEADNAPKEVPK